MGSRYDDVIDGGEATTVSPVARAATPSSTSAAATPSSSPSTSTSSSPTTCSSSAPCRTAPGTDFDSGVVEDLDGHIRERRAHRWRRRSTRSWSATSTVSSRIGALRRDVPGWTGRSASRPAAATTCSWSPPAPRPARRCTCDGERRRRQPGRARHQPPRGRRRRRSTGALGTIASQRAGRRRRPRSTHDTVEGVRIETFAGVGPGARRTASRCPTRSWTGHRRRRGRGRHQRRVRGRRGRPDDHQHRWPPRLHLRAAQARRRRRHRHRLARRLRRRRREHRHPHRRQGHRARHVRRRRRTSPSRASRSTSAPAPTRLTIDSTHAGPSRTTTVHGGPGDDTVLVRTVSGPTEIHLDGGDDTVRIGDPTTGASKLAGIAAYVDLFGGDGLDTLQLVGTAETDDLIGLMGKHTRADGSVRDIVGGLGMHLGGSSRCCLTGCRSSPSTAPCDGRFTLSVGTGADRRSARSSTTTPPPPRSGRPSSGSPASAPATSGQPGRRQLGDPLRRRAGRCRGLGEHAHVTGARPTSASPPSPTGGPVHTAVMQMTDGLVEYADFQALVITLGSGDDVLLVDSTPAGTTDGQHRQRQRPGVRRDHRRRHPASTAAAATTGSSSTRSASRTSPTASPARSRSTAATGSDFFLVTMWNVVTRTPHRRDPARPTSRRSTSSTPAARRAPPTCWSSTAPRSGDTFLLPQEPRRRRCPTAT